jgi:hypothetical protein
MLRPPPRSSRSKTRAVAAIPLEAAKGWSNVLRFQCPHCGTKHETEVQRLAWLESPQNETQGASAFGRNKRTMKTHGQPDPHGTTRMSAGDPRAEISHLETEIEELTEVIERCRKIILISKIAVAAAAILLLALTFGMIRFDPVAMIGTLAVLIGGTVIFGSNMSTAKQTAAAVQTAEALRAELIDKIDLRVVTEQTQS